MLEQFLNQLECIGPVKRSHRFLLAVSGGIDSMVMLDLFVRAGLQVGVAHCNFGLRPEEAAREEELVQSRCRQLGVPVFVERFDTVGYATSNDLSTQVAARELRYKFFLRTLEEHNFDWIATAHHLNDSLETTLLNLVRGTGLEGLSGIPRINGKIIRPLLYLTRAEVESHASQHNIEFLHDSSNFRDDYSRNLLRNKVIPLLKEINPGLEQTFRSTSARLQGSYGILAEKVRHIESQSITHHQDRILILKKTLIESEAPELLLWELIKRFGFAYDQCVNIISATHVGKRFSSDTFDLVNDRTHYILEKRVQRDVNSCLITPETSMVTMNNEVLEVEHHITADVRPGTDHSTAVLDSDHIVYPVCWRYWAAGDIFQPLGMTNHKKLSDFLIDRKVDRLAKEKVSVLESGGRIIWVVGQRISEEVKVTGKTERVTVFRWRGYPSAER